MGAIGTALLAKEERERGKDGEAETQHFIGLDALETLTWKQEANVPCPFCTNHCQRAVITFSNGNSWITNNRCERGEILGDPKDQKVQALVRDAGKKKDQIPNLYVLREKLLFADYLPKGRRRRIETSPSEFRES